MTVPGKDGKTAIEDLANIIFSAVKSYDDNKLQRNRIPGLLAYSIPKGSQTLSQLAKEIAEHKGRKAALKTSHDEQDSAIVEEIINATTDRNSCDEALKTIKSTKERYSTYDSSIEDLTAWAIEKSSHEATLKQAQMRFDNLTSDSRQLGEQMEKAREKNQLIYQNNELMLKKAFENTAGELRSTQDQIRAEEEQERQRIEAEYQTLLGGDWKSTELSLLDALVSLSVKLAACETVEDIRSTVENAPYIEDLLPVFSSVLEKRDARSLDLNSLRKEVDRARHQIEDELNRKESLEKDKGEKLARLSRATTEKLSSVEERIKTETVRHKKARILTTVRTPMKPSAKTIMPEFIGMILFYSQPWKSFNTQ